MGILLVLWWFAWVVLRYSSLSADDWEVVEDEVVEARDVDAGGHARGVVVAAEVASVGEAVELAAKGEAAAGVSAGFDVAALHFGVDGRFGGHRAPSGQGTGIRD